MTLKVTLSQRFTNRPTDRPTDQQTNQPTTKILEVLGVAKKKYSHQLISLYIYMLESYNLILFWSQWIACIGFIQEHSIKYQGSFCHVKVIAYPFSWKARHLLTWRKIVTCKAPDWKYPWFFFYIYFECYLRSKSSPLDEGGVRFSFF